MKGLSQREAAFAVHYTTIGSDTFSDGKKSAVAAGYSDRSAHVAASRLMKREKVGKRISELHSDNMQRNLITVDKVLADLEHDKVMARKHNQYAVAKGCTELQGIVCFLSDRYQRPPDPLSDFAYSPIREKFLEQLNFIFRPCNRGFFLGFSSSHVRKSICFGSKGKN